MKNTFPTSSFWKAFTGSVILSLFCLVAQNAAFAQVDQGAITGTVTDSAGRSSRAHRSLWSTRKQIFLSSAPTNDDGSYRFAPIKIGLYTLTVTAKGFETQKQENIRVDVSQTVGLNLSLKPGTVTESVTVTSSPELQTEDASTGQVFTTIQLDDLPLLNRNYLFLAQLTTGVNAPEPGQYADFRDGWIFIEWQPRLAKQLHSRRCRQQLQHAGLPEWRDLRCCVRLLTRWRSSRSKAATTAPNWADGPEQRSTRRSNREPTPSTAPCGSTFAATALLP